jgi:dienelactone hydrolase
MINRNFILSVSLLFCFNPLLAQDENLNVLDSWIEWSDNKNMLVRHLNDQAFSMLDGRDKEVQALKSRNDWLSRQRKVRETLMDIVGPFPEKTPLNPRIMDIIQKEGYRIEKIMFESQPDFFVTGCLFIPNGITGRRPAILNVIGHTDISYRSSFYQKMIFHFVEKGFIVFAIDPISQGERVQYYDPGNRASIIGSAGGVRGEHTYFGSQCYVSGVSPGRYFTWDGIRAIDYLVSREEVDPERIGVTGISGGGTQTAYISAFDERVKAAAPTCYITGFRRLLESIGTQDAEQNFFHAVKKGITHADFIVARAPKPTMIVATTRDIFSIQGVYETYDEVKKAYKALGKEDNIYLAVDDAGHTLSPENNEETVAFFQKHLDWPGDPTPGETITLPEEELNVTPTDMISTFIQGETVFSLNKKESQKLIEKLNKSRENIEGHIPTVILKAKELSGFVAPVREVKQVFRGRYNREGYSIEMYALHGQGNYVIPLLLFIPDNKDKSKNALIYLHPEGKIRDAAPEGKIEQLVKKGYMVAAVDLSGTGELSPDNAFYGKKSHVCVLTGKSITGIQAADAIIVARFLKRRTDVNKIDAIAYKELGPVLLHAAAFDNLIQSLTLVNSPVSYRSIVMNKHYNRDYMNNFVPGILTGYDLPDLAASLATGMLVIVNPADEKGNEIKKPLENEDIQFIQSVYRKKNAKKKLKIASGIPEENITELF